MQDPVKEIRDVVRALTEPRDSKQMLSAVDRYFTDDAVIVHPMLNSPPSLGKKGLASAYKMLRVLTIGNKITFHTVGFDNVVTRGANQVEQRTALIDLTETLQLRLLPLPTSVNPWFNIRFLIRVDLRKDSDGLWRIEKQEDNLPTDFGSTGLRILPFDASISNAFKWACGVGTFATASVIQRVFG